MYAFLKYKMGNMEGLMNPKNSIILSGIKICKMGTTIVQGFAYVKPVGFYPRCWWERWGYYRPHLEEFFSGFFLTITWPILVHLAWPRAHFDRTREGYKMISSEIPQTRGLPMTNPTYIQKNLVQLSMKQSAWIIGTMNITEWVDM